MTLLDGIQDLISCSLRGDGCSDDLEQIFLAFTVCVELGYACGCGQKFLGALASRRMVVLLCAFLCVWSGALSLSLMPVLASWQCTNRDTIAAST